MKLLQALKIACLHLLLMLPDMVQAQYYANPYYYSISNETVTITGYNGSYGTVAIPGTINLLPVTSIGAGAFQRKNMEIVMIGTNITTIGENAFYFCQNLTSVTIPNSVTNIGQGAFSTCNNLTSVIVGTNVINIGADAFSDTGLTSFTIPNSVTSIGTYAFATTSLTNITIPASITNIADYAFETCDWLTAITVDSNNPAYFSLAGVLFNKDQTILIQYPAGIYASYAIPNSVATIESRAFYFCNGLRGLTMSTNVASIGSEAFNGCTQLPIVTIPYSVTNIGDYAFQQCTVLSAIMVDTNNPAYESIAGVLFDKNGDTLITYPGGAVGSYTVPNSVSSILDWAFQASFYLTSISIPNSITNIGDDAFQQCYDLTSVYFEGNEPTSVGVYLFGNSGNPTIYYLPGTTGWTATFGGDPTVLWNPQAQNDASFGVQNNQFGFNIAGTSNIVVVVEACTNLANPVWSPVSTNTLNTAIGTNGMSYFSDPQWTNYPCRFYGFSWP